MENTKNFYTILDDAIGQNKWGSGYNEFPGPWYSSRLTHARVYRKFIACVPNTLTHAYSSTWIIFFDVYHRLLQVLYG